MIRTSARALVLILLLAGPVAGQQAGSQRPLAVTPAQFSPLRWLEGAWRGTGEDGRRFYERYTFVDDSTMQMASFADSTFRRSTEGDRVRLRDGVIRYENVVATALEPDCIRFNVPGREDGFTWQRTGSAGWVATLRWNGRAPVTYQMERVTPADTAAATRTEAARQAVLDYVEGFYEGDSIRLARSIWPPVRKYGYAPRVREGRSQYAGMEMRFPDEFFAFAADVRSGKRSTPPSAPKEITMFDVQDQTASAKLRAWWGTDYVLLAKEQGRWMITHVLWQGPPPSSAR